MLTKEGPKVLEFNARFGDPETQVYLPKMENDLVELLEVSVEGRLGEFGGGEDNKRKKASAPLPSPPKEEREKIRGAVKWREHAVVCVVMASPGYPGHYPKGIPIKGLKEVAKLPNTKVFHAGTARSGNGVVTNGGRVLGVTAWGEDLQAARDAAYEAVERIQFEGAQWRKDIAGKALNFKI